MWIVANRADAIAIMALLIAELLPLKGRERSLETPARRVAAGRNQDAQITEQKEIAMRVLRKLRKWWRDLWGGDFYWPAEVDSHQWDNKVEILRRLSSQAQ